MTKVVELDSLPIGYRMYAPQHKRLIYPEELNKRGVVITPIGEVITKDPTLVDGVVQSFVGRADSYKKPIFEGDICEVQVPTQFGSTMKVHTLVRWIPVAQQFAFHTENNFLAMQKGFMINHVKIVGNVFSDTKLLDKVYPSGDYGEGIKDA